MYINKDLKKIEPIRIGKNYQLTFNKKGSGYDMRLCYTDQSYEMMKDHVKCLVKGECNYDLVAAETLSEIKIKKRCHSIYILSVDGILNYPIDEIKESMLNSNEDQYQFERLYMDLKSFINSYRGKQWGEIIDEIYNKSLGVY